MSGSAVRHRTKAKRLPPRWFMRRFWFAHRRVFRWTRGRVGLWRPRKNGWGAMCVTTVGRRTGREHKVMVGYFEDGANLVAMAANGWQRAQPDWWLNARAHPEVTVQTRDRAWRARAHAADGAERDRLWARWREIDVGLDEYAVRRGEVETAVVVFEPTG